MTSSKAIPTEAMSLSELAKQLEAKHGRTDLATRLYLAVIEGRVEFPSMRTQADRLSLEEGEGDE